MTRCRDSIMNRYQVFATLAALLVTVALFIKEMCL